MIERLTKELVLLRQVFPDIEFLDRDSGWFRIPTFTDSSDLWNPHVFTVCFQAPTGFPGEAPYGFWVSPLPRLAISGAPPCNNYQEPSPTPFDGTWAKFSWAHDDSWRPGPEPSSGSNLLNFAMSFKDRLREGP
jgi:hypothetical protein